MSEEQSKVWENRILIYFLSITFMPVGFIVGTYFITHEDKKYNEIGEMIIRLIGIVVVGIILVSLKWYFYDSCAGC